MIKNNKLKLLKTLEKFKKGENQIYAFSFALTEGFRVKIKPQIFCFCEKYILARVDNMNTI